MQGKAGFCCTLKSEAGGENQKYDLKEIAVVVVGIIH